jgi:hypothetical protein
MPRKSYDQINNELSQCRRIVKHLSTDPDYGITTLAGAEYELASMKDQGYLSNYITLISFSPPTLEQPPNSVGKIKKICALRSPNITMRVRLSLHEILLFTEEDPIQVIASLWTSIAKEEMKANIAFKELSTDFMSDARTLQAIIQAKKTGYPA